ncbi:MULTISPECIES: nicotinate-nucleotide--dimethylbenzimidazole phosphoribosyltransferase [Xanthobacter]|uniref:nicotinate-nucleotide--dimethylbenzimidazole phosphoribosyltransferase n=1 Tax=Xanthobacter TaxID=279 RepID=UPI001E530E51|nr:MULTISPECIES: nicotinate-nucleotide--dimethylbenzimidazole phosphoribosyltransferase [Xanthobacter]UDQ87634.1 nicotinate-nucleotide--dimethylbenzimidazole phosphoribosyltransferase [Xanthobacter autotrophicus]UJX44467.1 nicotinate-nucleotide--dimethylbenzimidazole phosphoribosyltransferase [Xanthobacter sp. YC-JY1]
MFPQDPGSPFDDIRQLVATLPGPNEGAREAALARQEQLVKPPGALGRLEAIAAHLSAWQGNSMPTVNRPMVAVFAATHGVADLGVSPYPGEVTKQMMATFTAGKAAVNQICATFDAGLRVFDLALDYPTPDITTNAALDEKACAATMAFGMEAIAGGSDLLCLGEMGIGNTTVAAAICHGLYGGTAEEWVGAGTGAAGEVLERKIAAVRAAVAFHKEHLSDPLEVLRRLGGREIAAIAGAIIAARHEKVPVVLDGFVVTAAAAVLHAMNPNALDHCLAGHVSAEKAHRQLLDRLGLVPLLDLGMRLGEGSGAALSIGVVKAAVACHRGMATFAEAGVSEG